MSNVTKSASKIVLIWVSVTGCIGFLAVVFSNLKSENIVMAVVAIFSSMVSSVLTYYFAKRSKKADDLTP